MVSHHSFYLFVLVALGLLCCTLAFSSTRASYCGDFSCCKAWALSAQAAVVAAGRLSSCGTKAQSLCCLWNLPQPGTEPKSPASAGGFLSTVRPGKSLERFYR